MKTVLHWILAVSWVGAALVSAGGSFEKISTKNGVLLFEDGREVNLWGVNFQPSLSFEHAARMEDQGLLMPLAAKDLKQVADESFSEIQRIGVELIRIHLSPADFTDAEGNLVETIWLDMLDYVMAGADSRGLYVYLTFLNDIPHQGTQFPPNPESFAKKFARDEWMVNETAVQATENYIRQLLNRRNPYTRLLYKNDPALALLEPINEPAYAPPAEKRYNQVKDYVNGMVALFREEGLAQPVVWNCGWPRLIQGKEDVFQAVADSSVDVVSFCCYPGQDDLKEPFWKYPENLSTNNYLPYLQNCSDRDDWLGWLRRDAFSGKAKVVYEYETMCNQSAYLYPEMAKLFRSLGAQVAAQWTYGLTGYAEYLGGTHVFNLQTTPRKTASFMAAGEVFKTFPRFGKNEITSSVMDAFGGCAVSYPQDLCAVFTNGTLIYSGTLPADFIPLNAVPERIIGYGSSPFVQYGGKGLYFIEPDGDNTLKLTVYPDAAFIAPHWQELRTGAPVAQLDFTASHPFSLVRPGFKAPVDVYRLDRNFRVPVRVESDSSAITFSAQAGQYLIIKTSP